MHHGLQVISYSQMYWSWRNGRTDLENVDWTLDHTLGSIMDPVQCAKIFNSKEGSEVTCILISSSFDVMVKVLTYDL